MTKILVTSDIHGTIPQIEPADIFLICGDISPVDDMHTNNSQRKWFEGVFVPTISKLPAKHIVFIAGNHDVFLYNLYRRNDQHYLKNILPENVHYLCDSSITLEGIKIYGSPWVNRPEWGTPNSPVWSFSHDNSDYLAKRFNKIPDDVDILMTHSPPYGYCDMIQNMEYEGHIGSFELTEAINKKKPRYSFFGHIHSGDHNIVEICETPNSRPTLAVNVAHMSENYEPYYPIHILLHD